MSAQHRAPRRADLKVRDVLKRVGLIRRATNDRRNLLHLSKLSEFLVWARAHGYRQHPSPEKAIYEVARLEREDPAGNHPHVVIYRRERGEHLTLCADGAALVRRWMNDRRTA